MTKMMILIMETRPLKIMTLIRKWLFSTSGLRLNYVFNAVSIPFKLCLQLASNGLYKMQG
jgi:hypothetical protein